MPDRDGVSRHAVGLGVARAAFGAPAAAAPDACLRMLAPSRRIPGSARLYVGFFGVRELVLAGFLIAARRDLPKLRWAAAFGALADLGDTLLLLRDLLRGRAPQPAAAVLLSTGVSGSAASIALWREVGEALKEREVGEALKER